MNLKPTTELPDPDLAAFRTGPIALAGAGVVGRAILADCLSHGFDVILMDTAPDAVMRAVAEIAAEHPAVAGAATASPLPGLVAHRFGHGHGGSGPPPILIESISEKLELKQQFFAMAATALGHSCILATNTSNLSVAEVFSAIPEHPHCLGMHFFMPVAQRPLVELIARTAQPARSPGEIGATSGSLGSEVMLTAATTVRRCQDLAIALGKRSLQTRDSPGFVVNRLLAPYLNQALLLLGRGVTAEMLGVAATGFGMPFSPLRLIDLIGIRTAFDSGRVFWRHFPKRIDPAPILSGMIKAGRLGTAFGGGFLIADDRLAPQAADVVDKYARDQRQWTEQEVTGWLAIPMWIEAAEILRSGVVESFDAIELALSGGLGFGRPDGFFAYFDSLGATAMVALIDSAASASPRGMAAFSAGNGLIDCLRNGETPSSAIRNYVASGDRESVRLSDSLAAAATNRGGQP